MFCRISDELIDSLIVRKAHVPEDLAVGETGVSDLTGAVFFVLKFLGVHEDHKVRARGELGDVLAQARRRGPGAGKAFASRDEVVPHSSRLFKSFESI